VKVPPEDEVNAKLAPETGVVPFFTVIVRTEISPGFRLVVLAEIVA
jgi:hypothetical protein